MKVVKQYPATSTLFVLSRVQAIPARRIALLHGSLRAPLPGENWRPPREWIFFIHENSVRVFPLVFRHFRVAIAGEPAQGRSLGQLRSRIPSACAGRLDLSLRRCQQQHWFLQLHHKVDRTVKAPIRLYDLIPRIFAGSPDLAGKRGAGANRWGGFFARSYRLWRLAADR